MDRVSVWYCKRGVLSGLSNWNYSYMRLVLHLFLNERSVIQLLLLNIISFIFYFNNEIIRPTRVYLAVVHITSLFNVSFRLMSWGEKVLVGSFKISSWEALLGHRYSNLVFNSTLVLLKSLWNMLFRFYNLLCHLPLGNVELILERIGAFRNHVHFWWHGSHFRLALYHTSWSDLLLKILGLLKVGIVIDWRFVSMIQSLFRWKPSRNNSQSWISRFLFNQGLYNFSLFQQRLSSEMSLWFCLILNCSLWSGWFLYF